MTELPILFNGEMVRAILEGRKTQTRRVVKPQPIWHDFTGTSLSCGPGFVDYSGKLHRCPYGKPGSQLWVRETRFRFGLWVTNGKTETGKQKWRFQPTTEEVHYAVEDNAALADVKKTSCRKNGWYRRPSIHMPRWASRINLLVKAVRVERVQNITEADAVAEGAYKGHVCLCPDDQVIDQVRYCGACGGRLVDVVEEHFRPLWDSTVKKKDLPRFGWDANPWVWVVEFEKLGADHA